jgi:hypothetical protein
MKKLVIGKIIHVLLLLLYSLIVNAQDQIVIEGDVIYTKIISVKDCEIEYLIPRSSYRGLKKDMVKVEFVEKMYVKNLRKRELFKKECDFLLTKMSLSPLSYKVDLKRDSLLDLPYPALKYTFSNIDTVDFTYERNSKTIAYGYTRLFRLSSYIDEPIFGVEKSDYGVKFCLGINYEVDQINPIVQSMQMAIIFNLDNEDTVMIKPSVGIEPFNPPNSIQMLTRYDCSLQALKKLSTRRIISMSYIQSTGSVQINTTESISNAISTLCSWAISRMY